MIAKIGFMQGRLSPVIDGKIQAFPSEHWRSEFHTASRCGFRLMEWTLDHDNLRQNPLLSQEGQVEINKLVCTHNLNIPSLTGDCFMQAPFWKAKSRVKNELISNFFLVCEACSTVGIGLIVVPLVDNGKITCREEEDCIVSFMSSHADFFGRLNLRICFESDYPPDELARFMSRLPRHRFGINYDVGNSAALGYDPLEEFRAFGDQIVNVHIKDRLLGGTTVPLGQGNANFTLIMQLLRIHMYDGNYILQTARAQDSRHAETLIYYRDQVISWLETFN